MTSFKWFLLAFGGIALIVGSSVIANTLSITVAQRIRELATLRTLGASRRQVLRSVVLEAIVVGLVGSIVGLFVGLGLAKGLFVILGATGFELPKQGLVFQMRTVVVSRRHRHADRPVREPPARDPRDAHPADRGRPRRRRAAAGSLPSHGDPAGS